MCVSYPQFDVFGGTEVTWDVGLRGEDDNGAVDLAEMGIEAVAMDEAAKVGFYEQRWHADVHMMEAGVCNACM